MKFANSTTQELALASAPGARQRALDDLAVRSFFRLGLIEL